MSKALEITVALMLVSALFISVVPPAQADVSYDLWAKAGTIAVPGAPSIPVWGFSTTATGPALVPGPLIEAVQGELVTITLHNSLAEPVSIIFPAQNVQPTPVKDASGLFVSFSAIAPPSGMVVYQFTAGNPGSYLYESGAQPQKQVHMGLYGPMIVRPAPGSNQAYNDVRSAFDAELLVILSEIDPALHAAGASGGAYSISAFQPQYWLINGRTYPDTVSATSPSPGQPWSAKVNASPGQRILLRCLNAGFQNHSLTVNSIIAKVIGGEGSPLWKNGLDATYGVSSIVIGSGEGYDLLLTAPATSGNYHIYDRDLLHLVNAGTYPGGMIGLIQVP